MQRVRVDWRLTNQVRRTFDTTLEILANDMQQSGVADVMLDPPIEGGEWPSTFEKEGTWHHMGTTRMHDSPEHGVVDRNCKVHGISNLYVAGSSVFPTAGANFPTITIAALALRLSQHLIGELKQFASGAASEASKKSYAGASNMSTDEEVFASSLLGKSPDKFASSDGQAAVRMKMSKLQGC